MIRIAVRTIQSEKSIDDIFSGLYEKSIRTDKTLDFSNTVNMTDNKKDFIGYIKHESLYISRVRRMPFLKLLPRLNITISKSDEKQIEFKLGLWTMFVFIFIVLVLITLMYRLVVHQEFNEASVPPLVYSFLFFFLLWIELKMYERKFKDYFN